MQKRKVFFAAILGIFAEFLIALLAVSGHVTFRNGFISLVIIPLALPSILFIGYKSRKEIKEILKSRKMIVD